MTTQATTRLFGKTGGGIVNAATVGMSKGWDVAYVWYNNTYQLRVTSDDTLIVQSGHEIYEVTLSDRAIAKMRNLQAKADAITEEAGKKYMDNYYAQIGPR
jgi:hypothetical protein